MNSLSKICFFTAAASLVIWSCSKEKDDTDGNKKPQEQIEEVTLQKRSAKRGVCFNLGDFPSNDIPLLGTGCSWSYNWGSGTTEQAMSLFSRYEMDYCPMAWNASWDENAVRKFKAAHPECRYILAYNEPNLTDQANMTPAAAAKDWPRLVAIANELDMKIIAPAMNYGTLSGYSDPWKWLDEFFNQPGVDIDDVDGIAVHCYMSHPSAMNWFIGEFKRYGKPIWLTEFCSWEGNISEKEQTRYLIEALHILESDKDVFRYAWFIPRTHDESPCHNNLLEDPEKGLTPLGKIYVNMSTLDKTLWYRPEDIIPAEHYTGYSGSLGIAPTSDSAGMLQIYGLGPGNKAEYQIDLPETGEYTIDIRYNADADGKLKFRLDGKDLGTSIMPNTYISWRNHKVILSLPEGRHTLEMSCTEDSQAKINWLRVLI